MKNNCPATGTIIRTVILAIALANQVLTSLGYSTIPIHDSEVRILVTVSITVGASLVSWWKNNSFTKSAKLADKTMKIKK